MAKCAALTRAGGCCKGEATHGSYCWSHAPETAEARKRRASKGGRAGGNGRPGGSSELAEVKTLLATLTARVLEEEGTEALGAGPAAVANQLINTRLRAIELERKVREQEDVLEHIEALERRAQLPGGARAWR